MASAALPCHHTTALAAKQLGGEQVMAIRLVVCWHLTMNLAPALDRIEALRVDDGRDGIRYRSNTASCCSGANLTTTALPYHGFRQLRKASIYQPCSLATVPFFFVWQHPHTDNKLTNMPPTPSPML